jgi:patatin-like phospholipase/acyl hydrolase
MNQPVGNIERAKLKILSLDGGGIKGVFPAAFLSEIEKSLKSPLHRYFDLIVGTSTGGIIALGLGFGLSAARILDFYYEHGPKIFAEGSGWIRRIFGSKYSPAALRGALEEVFGDAKLGDSKVRLMIPSFNANNGEIHIYKTRHHARFMMDYKVSMVDVALATAAAPTYFPAHKGAGGALYLDGGLWANNPVGNAAVEAITWLKRSATDVDILSIGCTQFPASFVGSTGLKGWAFGFAEAALRAQSGGSLGIAYSLLGHESIKRVNPIAPQGKFSVDNVKAVDELASFGYLEARKECSDLCPRFMAAEAPIFSPIPLT